MESVLILNQAKYPSEFSSINITPPAGVSKTKHIEDRIIAAINRYNPKLNVTRIEYDVIETKFPNYQKGNKNGLLVEEFSINPALSAKYRAHECYVNNTPNGCMCQRILMYVFLSNVVEGSRTSFISQTVFPGLLDYAEQYLASPSYTIANHKFCYIDILNKTVTASMILRHLSGLCAAGMDYVDVFGTGSVVVNQIPKNLKDFLRDYSSDFTANYSAVNDVYDDDNYEVDFRHKKLTIKTANMISKLVPKTATTVDFNGSAEKFYWIETLPMAIFAYDTGYKVDYTQYDTFINTYKARFSSSSDKFARCETLLAYMKKYFI